MGAQNQPPKESRIILVQTPLGDILFYDRVEAGKYRDGKAVPEKGSAPPDKARWPNHRLCGITEDGEEGWLRLYYMADRAQQEVYNYEYAHQLSNEWPEMVQTWVFLRETWEPGAQAQPPALGREWTFMGESQRQMDPTTSMLFVVVQQTWRDITAHLQTSRVDGDSGERVNELRKMVPAGTLATPVQSDGTYSEVRDLNEQWAIEEVKKLRGLAGAVTKSRTWSTTVNMGWPRVLSHPVLDVIPSASGGIGKIFFVPVWLRGRYYGPCKATITLQWTLTAPTITPPTVMLENEVSFDGALLNIDIPTCLHRQLRLFESSGDGTDQYAPYQLAWNYPATNYIDWPATITYQDSVERDQGGYLRTTIVIERPDVGNTPLIYLEVTAISATGFTLGWALENSAGPASYLLDVAEDPEFTFGFLPGYKGKVKGTGTTETVTLPRANKVYFARVRWGGITSNTVTGIAKPVPVIEVQQPADTVILNGATVAFGNVFVGVATTRTFRLRNAGTWPLGDLVVTSSTARYVVSVLETEVLEAGETTDFTVTCTPITTGATPATLEISSSDGITPTFTINLTATGVEPEIQLEQPAATILTSGVSSKDFGSVNTGSTSSLTFTLRSVGTGALEGLGVFLTGTNADQWAVTASPPETVDAGTSTTFTVQFEPDFAATGAQTATLNVVSNDGDENPFTVALTGTAVPVPEIAVEDPLGNSLVDNVGSYDLGRVQNGSSGAAQTVTIRNLGGANLTSLVVTKSGTNSADFTLGSLSGTTVTPGSSATFTVSFVPATGGGGTRTATLSIASNDGDENPFRMIVVGTEGPAGAEIQVEEPVGNVLVDGSSVIDWGPQPVGTSPAVKTVTIRNIGNSNLTSLAVSKTGEHAADLTLGSLGATTLAPSATTTFSLTASAATIGYKEIAIAIASNDSDENPFNLGIGLTVTPPNALTSFQSANVVVGQADFTSADTTVNASTLLGTGITFAAVCPVTGRLAVSDRSRNRVLIWNTVPTANGVAADYVLGQANFTNSAASVSSTRMNSPQHLAFSPDGAKLLICDVGNNRVLIFNMGSLATGMAAANVIGQGNFTGTSFGLSQTKFTLPTGVHVSSDGRVLISDFGNLRVLVWNSIPTTNGAAANVVIGQTNFTNQSVNFGATGLTEPEGLTTAGGKLFVTCRASNGVPDGRCVKIFNAIPTSNGVAANNILGQLAFGSVVSPVTSRKVYADGARAVAVSSLGYVAVANDSRVMVYYAVPTTDGVGADAVLGQANFTDAIAFAPSGTRGAANLDECHTLSWTTDHKLIVGSLGRVLIFTP